MADLKALGFEDETEKLNALGFEEETPARQDWGDAANTGASVVQAPPGPESIASEPYGPMENPYPIGSAEAIAHQYLAGFWKQGSDEGIGAITAAAQPAGNGAAWKQPDGSVRLLDATGDVYRAGRDTERDTLRRADEQHPLKSFAANMAGDITSDAVLRAFGVPITSQGYQVASGALSGLLGGTADLTQPDASALAEAAGDTALGGGMAYAIPVAGRYAGRKIGPYVSRAADAVGDWWNTTAAQDWLENFARERALKASGYIQKDFARGAARRDQLIRGAQELLDEPGLIGPFSSKAAIADRLEPLVEREGQNIGRALDAADAAALAGDWSGRPFNRHAFAPDAERLRAAGEWRGGPYNPYAFIADARENVSAPFIDSPSTATAGHGINDWLDRLDNTASERLPARGQLMTFLRANEYKGDLQDAVFNTRGDVKPNVNARAQYELQRLMTQDIDRQAMPFLGPDQLAEFQQSRRLYGTFKDAFDEATQGANRDAGNNALGLKDWQAAQTFAQAAEKTPGLGWAAPLVAVGSKLVRGRADSFAARTADALAQPNWLQSVAETQPEAFGQWAQYLTAAASRSPEALNLAHSNLAETDPEYQQRMRLLGGQER